MSLPPWDARHPQCPACRSVTLKLHCDADGVRGCRWMRCTKCGSLIDLLTGGYVLAIDPDQK